MTQAPDASDATLAAARSALDRHEWRQALDLLSAADARGELDATGLQLLATSAWWSGRFADAIEGHERAYAAAIKAQDPEHAVSAALDLAVGNLQRMAIGVANAWLNRAERILEGQPESPGHGWLAAVRSFHDHLAGDGEGALAQASRALDIATRHAVPDLAAFAMAEKASALIARGDLTEGLALADEATVIAVSGELDPSLAGAVCCSTIEACTIAGDLKRAAEWTEAQDRWCRREGITGYPGMCRLFRSEIKTLRGDWAAAEAEARVASEELRGYVPAAAGLALYQIGEIRLRRGDLPAAEEALLGAHAANQDTQPAMALLRLAQGRADAAAASIEVALSEPGRSPSWKAPSDSLAYRLHLLPAQVEIALARGDAALARTAANELAALAERFGTAPATAAARSALGSVTLAEGDSNAAVRHLRDAVAGWIELDAPYQAARARVELARAYAASGADDEARIELRTAREGFERLGAALDLRTASELESQLTGGAAATPLGMQAVRTERAFMFTDIVDSTRLAEAMGDEAWDAVTRSHDRVLRAAAAEHRGEEVKATGDGFFFAFADADDAIAAAVAMQRRLAEQREAQAFAPVVRIGIHQAQANRVGLDYAGIGVNQAARIGAAADGGEILVSASSVAGLQRPVTEAGRRTAELKGLSEPVEIVSVSWR
ncbi:MAG TPA: adenylate/guanylate cyclase domain-containing protein [Candidatus Limnocylindria bacterium]|nr:adenylate/guanylate cyclase domain-containing protein [Candidatus Limnocylindria bacterium]